MLISRTYLRLLWLCAPLFIVFSCWILTHGQSENQQTIPYVFQDIPEAARYILDNSLNAKTPTSMLVNTNAYVFIAKQEPESALTSFLIARCFGSVQGAYKVENVTMLMRTLIALAPRDSLEESIIEALRAKLHFIRAQHDSNEKETKNGLRLITKIQAGNNHQVLERVCLQLKADALHPRADDWVQLERDIEMYAARVSDFSFEARLIALRREIWQHASGSPKWLDIHREIFELAMAQDWTQSGFADNPWLASSVTEVLFYLNPPSFQKHALEQFLGKLDDRNDPFQRGGFPHRSYAYYLLGRYYMDSSGDMQQAQRSFELGLNYATPDERWRYEHVLSYTEKKLIQESHRSGILAGEAPSLRSEYPPVAAQSKIGLTSKSADLSTSLDSLNVHSP